MNYEHIHLVHKVYIFYLIRSGLRKSIKLQNVKQ